MFAGALCCLVGSLVGSFGNLSTLRLSPPLGDYVFGESIPKGTLPRFLPGLGECQGAQGSVAPSQRNQLPVALRGAPVFWIFGAGARWPAKLLAETLWTYDGPNFVCFEACLPGRKARTLMVLSGGPPLGDETFAAACGKLSAVHTPFWLS